MNWEVVVEHRPGAGENSTYRLRIPEGWIYRYGSQLVFVANPLAAMNVSSVNPYIANTYGALGAKPQY